MLASKYHINTSKEAPAEAEVISHKYMLRAGMIRKLGAGIYTYMPLGFKVLKKVEAIVREEMNNAGAIELLMPVVQPAELWMKTERWNAYGPELLRFKDRHSRDFIIQPTSEEVITDIVANEVHSWRQLPLNFYHIQTKFRDERRPRFGLMRGREFLMKDAYSFDRNEEEANKSYQKMYDAYTRIFTRLGLKFRAVNADTGSIGGSRSHEFQVIAQTGEDLIVYNPNSDYAANIELAEAVSLIDKRAPATRDLELVETPNCTKCELVAEYLNVPLETNVKSVVFSVEKDSGEKVLCMLLIRADHELNDVKVSKLPIFKEAKSYDMATEAQIMEFFGSTPGYLGPVKPLKEVVVIADRTVANMSDFICGGNKDGTHYVGVNWGRDLPEPQVEDIRNVVEGDPSADGNGTLAIDRGIEVGHVFFLGDKYSSKLRAVYLDEHGKEAVIQMGCYGIGVSRIVAAAIEQNHDENGIKWPLPMAPYEIVICPIGWSKSEEVKAKCLELYEQFKAAGYDVILDDRDMRPGVMFTEWELIGIPIRVTVGERGLKEGVIEVQKRTESEAKKLSLTEVSNYVKSVYEDLSIRV
ncbi:prolyl-tRNA synthetase [Taylorella asinigenitalis 14/45]|uniref:Proline--tRNA ligase n=1 Tax=Taylorella asinigenitalis 14/45 TaxID=1091495 RepID=I7IKB4_9BURK|nr:proline--tRNA ligase [Taylorella asinigenitalis]CCG19042.1 prolyl-tRNA synthetase [Taylorella asinigenitalis 14/45]